MAIYTTLFSATLRELEERFPNVGDSLSAPRLVERTNPFTKLPIEVEVFEPEFGVPRHRHSLFSEAAPPPIEALFRQHDDYGRYLRSLVPPRLRSLPHVGTKNVDFEDAKALLGFHKAQPEKFVQCLPGEGSVSVAPAELTRALRTVPLAELQSRADQAGLPVPFEWFTAVLQGASPTEQRFLCLWYRL